MAPAGDVYLCRYDRLMWFIDPETAGYIGLSTISEIDGIHIITYIYIYILYIYIIHISIIHIHH